MQSVQELCTRIRAIIDSRTQTLSEELARLRRELDEALADAEAVSEVNALLQAKLDAKGDVLAGELLRQGALEERASIVAWLRAQSDRVHRREPLEWNDNDQNPNLTDVANAIEAR